MMMDELVGSEDYILLDLRNLRLVSRQMAQAATPILFCDAAVWISLDGLRRFTNISEHPQLQVHHSKSIEFLFSTLQADLIPEVNM